LRYLLLNHPGKLCPHGCHVSSDADWDEMVSFLGGTDIAGGKMKEAETDHGVSPQLK
jgi:hypothetical protein